MLLRRYVLAGLEALAADVLRMGGRNIWFLAWAWLAKAKGHSCHTKKINPCQNIYGKNE